MALLSVSLMILREGGFFLEGGGRGVVKSQTVFSHESSKKIENWRGQNFAQPSIVNPVEMEAVSYVPNQLF